MTLQISEIYKKIISIIMLILLAASIFLMAIGQVFKNILVIVSGGLLLTFIMVLFIGLMLVIKDDI